MNSWMLSDSPASPPVRLWTAHVTPHVMWRQPATGVRAQRSARPPSEPVVFTSECLEQTSAHKTSPRIWPRRVRPSVNHQLVLGFFLFDHFSFLFLKPWFGFCWVCFSASPLRPGQMKLSHSAVGPVIYHHGSGSQSGRVLFCYNNISRALTHLIYRLTYRRGSQTRAFTSEQIKSDTLFSLWLY